jgi:LysM repeat protein
MLALAGEGAVMFALKVAKPKTETVAGPMSALAGQRSALKAQRFGRDVAEQVPGIPRQIAYPSWNFAKIPVFPPARPDRPGPLFPLTALPPGAPLQAKLPVGRTGDPLEGEADRIADQVMRVPDPQRSLIDSPPQVSRKFGTCEEQEAEALRIKQAGMPGTVAGNAPGIVHEVLRSPGQLLDEPTRAFFEPRFGRDFSQVRVHADEQAARSARAIGARAYTAGQAIVFGQGAFTPGNEAGRRLLAHELTHLVQQSTSRAAGGIQRYEAGEHAQFGETGTELKALINAPAQIYVVKPGDTLASIAAAFAVPIGDLVKRNKDKIKHFPWHGKKNVPGKKNKTVVGFRAGERIEIPQVLNQPMREALTVDELSYEAGQPDAGKRATVKYGEGIAMGGDLFADPGQIDATPKEKIENLQSLIQGEKTSSKTGKFVEAKKWETATEGRFADLASKNESHFAPSDPSVVSAASPASTSNHKTTWEHYHTDALNSSQGGDRDKALEINSFADHFLTDAFSAGHLINKLDVAEKFKGGIATTIPDPKKPTEKKIAPANVGFFDQVAQKSFVGVVKTEFSQYETVEWKGGIFRPNIDSVSRFSTLLQGIYTDPRGTDYVLGSVVKVAHDDLSTKTGGISVENQKGDKWQLPGDRTLNASTVDPKDAAKTLEVGRKAVAQSQYNVLSVFQRPGPLDLPNLFKAVWDYVPRPTSTGAADIKTIVYTDTDPKQAALVSKLAKLITDEYQTIIKKLVDLKILKRA